MELLPAPSFVLTIAACVGRLRNLDVQYVSGNPLDYVELTAKIDVTR